MEDWTTKAARSICGERLSNPRSADDQERIASIIAAHAEPLVALLRESKQWRHQVGCAARSGLRAPSQWPCDCSANAWNTRVEAALSARER